MKCLISSFDLKSEGSLPLSSLTQLGHSKSLPSPFPVPAACTGTFWVYSYPIPSLCCQHWDILSPPLPLSSPFVSLPSHHHGVTGSSCHWSLPAQKQQPPAHVLPMECPVPDAGCSVLCRGAGQALPSPCPPPQAAIQVPQEVPALLLPYQGSRAGGG